MNNNADLISDRRLDQLEQQAALYGPMTDPAILIEIADLKSKRRNSSSAERRQFVSGLDYQFLMDVVAAALVRLGRVESSLAQNDRKRLVRQLIHDLWMVAITTMIFILLWMQVVAK
jgi:hypothetical protein